MNPYQNWKSRSLSVGALKLDPGNPRIPSDDPLERQILEELATSHKVLTIAESIANRGYLPNESLIVCYESGKPVVIEGNRRLAALKLMHNPELAPANLRAKLKRFASKLPSDLLANIPVLIAGDRDEVTPLLISRHGLNLIEAWSTLMQAKFYASKLVPGKSLEDVAAELNIAPSELKEKVIMHRMHAMAVVLPLPEDVKRQVADSLHFPVSSLHRFYRGPEGQKFLGIEFDGSGEVRVKIKEQEFTKGYTKVITDIVNDVFNTRKINSVEDLKKYLVNIPTADRPDATPSKPFTSSEYLKKHSDSLPASSPIQRKKRKPSRKEHEGLIPGYMICAVNHARIEALFKELKALPVDEFENSVAVMLRVLLEVSLSWYLSKTGAITTIISAYRQARQKDREKKLLKAGLDPKKAPPLEIEKHWTPGLHEMLMYVHNNPQTIGDNAVAKALAQTANEELFHLNLAAHNYSYSPSEKDLRATWKKVESLFTILLRK